MSRVLNITDNLCIKQGNVGLKFLNGFKSRPGYNGARMVINSKANDLISNSLLRSKREKKAVAIVFSKLHRGSFCKFHYDGLQQAVFIKKWLFFLS